MNARPLIFLVPTMLVVSLLATVLPAQGYLSLQPFTRTGDILVSDSTGDKLWRLQDLNLDGDYNDAGEIINFYDDTLPGALVLTANNDVGIAANGTAYVCDSNTDLVLAFRDLNGDGDAQDTNEAYPFFDGHAGMNASGIDMGSASSVLPDAAGAIWVAAGNALSGGVPVGVDMILRLEDLNQDKDANDPLESKIFRSVPGVAIGDSIVTDVVIAPDGRIYYTDNGLAPGMKGVYRCDDMNGDGDADDPGETTLYFQPPPQPGNTFLQGLTFAPDGTIYACDTGNEIIWRAFDANGNLQIDVGTEEQIFYQHGGSATMWRPEIASDGSVWAVDDTIPDRIVRMMDGNGNGNALDPGEYSVVYDETVGAQGVFGARGMSFMRAPALVVSSNTPTIGSLLTLSIEGAANDWFTLWASSASIPGMLAPPFGTLGISIFPPDFFFEVFNGNLPASGTLTTSFVIPTAGALIGLSTHLQAMDGLYRLQLTDAQSITFQ